MLTVIGRHEHGALTLLVRSQVSACAGNRIDLMGMV